MQRQYYTIANKIFTLVFTISIASVVSLPYHEKVWLVISIYQRIYLNFTLVQMFVPVFAFLILVLND